MVLCDACGFWVHASCMGWVGAFSPWGLGYSLTVVPDKQTRRWEHPTGDFHLSVMRHQTMQSSYRRSEKDRFGALGYIGVVPVGARPPLRTFRQADRFDRATKVAL
jgi:hypothetical protein